MEVQIVRKKRILFRTSQRSKKHQQTSSMKEYRIEMEITDLSAKNIFHMELIATLNILTNKRKTIVLEIIKSLAHNSSLEGNLLTTKCICSITNEKEGRKS